MPEYQDRIQKASPARSAGQAAAASPFFGGESAGRQPVQAQFWQAAANRSPQVLQLQAYQEMADARPGGGAGISGADPALIIQRMPKTSGGEWKPLIYSEYNGVANDGKTPLRGVDIKLEFAPNDTVQAEKIGLTQSILSLEQGEPHFLGDDVREKAINKTRVIPEGPYKGTSIDRIPTNGLNNPIYGAEALAAGKTLEDTTMPAQNEDTREEAKSVGGIFNRLGKRTQEETVSAVLSDTPRRQAPLAANSRQEFETTALALKGPDIGKYYGSVKWGWHTDAEGKFTKIDLAVVKEGNPSEQFAAAAEQWNKGHSRSDPFGGTFENNIPLPIPKDQ